MHRITFEFELYGQGFSETLFRADPFAPTNLINLEDYLQKRMNLMCTDGTLTSVRMSNVDNPRDIIIYLDDTQKRRGTFAAPGGPTTVNPGSETNADNVFTAVLLRLSGGNTQFRTFKMLGVPDDIVTGNALFPSRSPDFRNRLNLWMQAMSGAALGMKAQGAPAATGRIVKFFPKTDDNNLICLGVDGPLPAVGSYVTLGSVKGFPKLNRKWKIASNGPAAAPDPQFIYLAGSKQLSVSGPVEGGTWKAPTYGLTVLTAYTVSRLTSRKTGVPFGVVRGRR